MIEDTIIVHTEYIVVGAIIHNVGAIMVQLQGFI